jgi:hypothetical protein
MMEVMFLLNAVTYSNRQGFLLTFTRALAKRASDGTSRDSRVKDRPWAPARPVRPMRCT